MRLYVGMAQDVVVKRTIDKNEQKRVAGNLYNREVVVKYEIENFKDKAVTLDISENVRAFRNEVAGDNGPRRAVGTGQGNDLRGRARQGEEHLRAGCCSTSISRPAAPTARPRRSSTSCTCSSRTSGNDLGLVHPSIASKRTAMKSHPHVHNPRAGPRR